MNLPSVEMMIKMLDYLNKKTLFILRPHFPQAEANIYVYEVACQVDRAADKYVMQVLGIIPVH